MRRGEIKGFRRRVLCVPDRGSVLDLELRPLLPLPAVDAQQAGEVERGAAGVQQGGAGKLGAGGAEGDRLQAAALRLPVRKQLTWLVPTTLAATARAPVSTKRGSGLPAP